MKPYLTDEQLHSYHQDGYLVLPGFLNGQEVSRMVDRAASLLNDFDINSHPLSAFKTGEGVADKHSDDRYFLESGDKVRYFLEEGSLDSEGQLQVDKQASVNKIGHALHDLDDVCNDTTFDPKVRAIVQQLAFRDPRVLQSMLIYKQPNIGGAVPPHQDSSFLHTDPLSAVGFWYALEDCTEENGCLQFAPGSQSTQVTSRFIRVPGEVEARFIGEKTPPLPDNMYRLEPCPAGTLVIIHGSVLHRSSANTSPHRRLAYTFHIIEGEDRYSKDNWLQPTTKEGFSKLYR